ICGGLRALGSRVGGTHAAVAGRGESFSGRLLRALSQVVRGQCDADRAHARRFAETVEGSPGSGLTHGGRRRGREASRERARKAPQAPVSACAPASREDSSRAGGRGQAGTRGGRGLLDPVAGAPSVAERSGRVRRSRGRLCGRLRGFSAVVGTAAFGRRARRTRRYAGHLGGPSRNAGTVRGNAWSLGPAAREAR